MLASCFGLSCDWRQPWYWYGESHLLPNTGQCCPKRSLNRTILMHGRHWPVFKDLETFKGRRSLWEEVLLGLIFGDGWILLRVPSKSWLYPCQHRIKLEWLINIKAKVVFVWFNPSWFIRSRAITRVCPEASIPRCVWCREWREASQPRKQPFWCQPWGQGTSFEALAWSHCLDWVAICMG